MPHAHKSPSGAARYHACPGSLAYANTLPEALRSSGGAAADLGTAAHALLEHCIQAQREPIEYLGYHVFVQEDHKASIPKHLGTEPLPDGYFEVDHEMVRGVDIAYQYVTPKREHAIIYTEQTVNPLPGRLDTSGTADIILRTWPDSLEVVDYKNGRIAVEHRHNPQVLAYLLGAAERFNWGYENYAITIIQPNAHHEDGNTRTSHIGEEELLAFRNMHSRACRRVDQAARELPVIEFETWANRWIIAGEHCSYCPMAGICPKRFELTCEQLGEEFNDA